MQSAVNSGHQERAAWEKGQILRQFLLQKDERPNEWSVPFRVDASAYRMPYTVCTVPHSTYGGRLAVLR